MTKEGLLLLYFHRIIGLVLSVVLLNACGGTAPVTEPEQVTMVMVSPPAATPTPEGADPEEIYNMQAVEEEATVLGELPVEPVVPVLDENVVAVVNGEFITRAEFDAALAQSQLGGLAADDEALRATVLDLLIEQNLIEQAAQAANIHVSEAQIEAEIQALRGEITDDAAWQEWLAQNNMSESVLRASLYDNLITTQMRDYVTQDISDTVLQVRARHIVVESQSDAQHVLDRLRAGEDFAALALAYSKDVTTRENGGDLGWFLDGELLEQELTQVAFALEPGQVAGPVVTRLGYHIVQTLEKEERPLAEEKRPVLAQITFERWLQGLTYNAIIQRNL